MLGKSGIIQKIVVVFVIDAVTDPRAWPVTAWAPDSASPQATAG